MSKKKNIEESLIKNIEQLNRSISKNNIIELSELLGNTKKLIIKNFLSGIAKGFGIGIGFSLLTAVIVYFLQKLVRLNIPVIGDYISDIVDIVNKGR